MLWINRHVVLLATVGMPASILNAAAALQKEDKPFRPMQVMMILDRKAFYESIYRYSGVEAEGQHQTILSPCDLFRYPCEYVGWLLPVSALK